MIKNKWIWLACIVFVLAVGGIFIIRSVSDVPPEVIEIPSSGDLAYSTPEQLLERSDLVVVGTYLGDEECRVSPWMAYPITSGTVTVDSELKGTCGETVTITFYGGEIPYREFLAMEEELGHEPAFKSTDRKAKNKVIRMMKDAFSVNAVPGQRYIIYLNYSDKDDMYFVGSNAYSMRPLNEKGQALNPDTQNYETLHILEEAKK